MGGPEQPVGGNFRTAHRVNEGIMTIRRLLGRALGALALAASTLTLAAASGQNTGVTIVNDNDNTMVRLFVNQRQVLNAPVGPGQSVWIDANDGRGACVVVITAWYDDRSSTVGQVDVCQVAQYPASARGIPICPGDARCKGPT